MTRGGARDVRHRSPRADPAAPLAGEARPLATEVTVPPGGAVSFGPAGSGHPTPPQRQATPERAASSGRPATSPHDVPPAMTPVPAAEPVLPAFGGACLSTLVPALLTHLDGDRAAEWLPEPVRRAERVVLLVLDGLGWLQLEDNGDEAPVLSSLAGGPITSVAPTTTATALTSITTGLPPAEHGVVGYRMRTPQGVLNVLRWTTPGGDARRSLAPETIQPRRPFAGRQVPVVSRAEFAGTGFSDAHLAGLPLHGWRVPSSIGVEVSALLAGGERLIYAYYDGIDKVAHERGLGEHYRAEIRFADRLVEDLLARLPADAALLVTADHGQVEVTRPPIEVAAALADDLDGLSGEGRFRWLHAKPGRATALAERSRELFSEVAWVRELEEIVEEGWFGGPLAGPVAARLGDVALVARAPVAFLDPADTGELRLVARHGSLTAEEMLVPLLAGAR